MALPAIPREFVALYPPLWHLSIDPACRSMLWRPKRAIFRRPRMIDPLGAIDHYLLDQIRSAPGSRLTRSQLRHRLSWRISARLLDHTLSRLLAQNWVTLAPDGWIYPNAGS